MKINYTKNNILNLLASLIKSFNCSTEYKTLSELPPKILKKYKNIVLIVIDGLGYEQLAKFKENFKESFLWENTKARITSVFPPTTAAAMTSFFTALSPARHGIFAWFLNLKELGVISLPIPFQPRFADINLSNFVSPEKIFKAKSIFEKIKINSYFVIHKKLAKSVFTKTFTKNAKVISARNLKTFFKKIKKLTKKKERKFIMAYWHLYDALCHYYGTNSKEARNHLKEIDKYVEKFSKKFKDTILIITADHGLINTTKKKVIFLEDHPKLEETLSMPLCGEARTIFCYVHPSKVKEFERYIKTKLNHACKLYKAEELIKKKYFGLEKASPDFFHRIGDYILIMKEHYIMEDHLINQEGHFYKGNHGGLSKEELYVPLIVVEK